jgi:cytochrome oxidase assembly protein ShyY1
MAEPLRNNSEHERRNTTPELRIYHGGADRSRKTWLWLLIMAVVAGLAIWGISRSNSKAHHAAPVAPAATTPAVNPPIDVPTLLTNKDTYLGKPVHLRDVLVQSVNGNNSVFVGPSDGQQVLVILKSGAVPDSLQGKTRTLPKGGIVTITGTAEKPGSVTDLEHSAKITGKEAEQVIQQGVVVQADRAQPQTM